MKKQNEEINCIEEIDVVRKEEGLIHIIGHSNLAYPGRVDKFHHIVVDEKSTKILAEENFRYIRSVGLDAAKAFAGLGVGIPFLIYQKTGDRPERLEKSIDIIEKIGKYQLKNINELNEEIKHIEVYQTNIEETSKMLGKELEIINTGRSQKFIHSHDPFYLSVKAHLLGADAIIMYASLGEGVCGTPVRYKQK